MRPDDPLHARAADLPSAAAVEAFLTRGGDLLASLDAAGVVTWTNPRFVQATGLDPARVRGCPLARLVKPQTDLYALHEALRGDGAAALELALPAADGGTLWCTARLARCDDGFAAVLQDRSELRRREQEARRLADLLDMAQEFGRLGVWERAIPSGEGRWDRHVFRFFDMDPAAGTPDFAQAAQRIHPDDRAGIGYAESTRTPGYYEKRYRVLRSDGGVRVIHSHWRVLADGDGRPYRAVGIMVDDSEVYDLARSLGEARERLALAVELGGIATWRHDLKTGLMHYDDRAFDVLGLPKRPQGIPIDEVRAWIHPDDLPAVLASAQRALADGGPNDVEARYRHADGSWRYVMMRRVLQRDADGRPAAFVGVGLDVTERKRTEAALQQADERVALAARGAGIGTWAQDLATGDVFWDDQMFVLRGLAPRPQALSEDERLAITHPDDRATVLDAVRRSLATGEPSTYEFRIRRPDGEWRWLASRTQPVRDRDGRIVRQTGVNWDVTDAKQAEVHRQQRIAAEHESRAKTAFLARMSHELRTPLNAVLGFTQLLLADRGLGSEQRVRIEHVHDAGEHLLSLINDVLDLSSLESGEMRFQIGAVPLPALVREAMARVEPQARERGVTLRCGALDATVRADAARLRQALLNLLSNAIKYNRDGGDVTVAAIVDGPTVRLAVRDSGRGLGAEQLEHLFEPFQRLEGDRVQGTGIGLAIVKAIVDQLGGRITASSEPGVGSTFTIELANARGDTAPAPPAPQPYAGRLLYIEDNPVNVLIVEQLIARCPGLALDTAPDGERGVAHAARQRPDLVLVDMQLPDFDGHEVLRRLRADPATADIPCIALSANAMPEDIRQARAAGFVDYWTKPIDFRAFIAALDARFGTR